MAEFFGVLAVLSGIVAAVFMMRASSAEAARAQLAGRLGELEKKVQGAQEDANKAREEARKKAAALEEARERANKSVRKEARKERAADKDEDKAPAGGPDAAQLAQYAAAVEAANRRAADAEKKANASLDTVRADARKDAEAEIADLKKRLQKVEEDRKQADRDRAEAARKAEEEARKGPNVPGTRLDLKALDPAVVEELRRYFKRANNAEKMLALAEGQLELATDKVEETQKRYFAVCRELALVAVNKDKPAEVADAEAAKLAMDMVHASEDADERRALARGKDRRGDRPARPDRRERAATPAGAPAAGGVDRPRGPRRDRRPGETANPASEPAQAAAKRPESDAVKAPGAGAEPSNDRGGPTPASAAKPADAPQA